MLKTKWRKQKEKTLARHWGALWTILQVNPKVSKYMDQKEVRKQALVILSLQIP